MRRRGAIGAIVCLLAACSAGGAAVAPCRTSGPYDKWLTEFEREAISQGISQQAISAAFLGLKTRQAVKAMQVKYNLPADSYPTGELLARTRGSH